MTNLERKLNEIFADAELTMHFLPMQNEELILWIKSFVGEESGTLVSMDATMRAIERAKNEVRKNKK